MKSHLLPLGFAALLLTLLSLPAAAQNRPHNIIIFVADGLRYGSVEPGNTPNMARIKRQGVDFTNSHSLYPTVTTVNASAIATGHYIGDTGNFGNTLYTGQTMESTGGTLGFLENNEVIAEMNQKFGGNYLGETTLIEAARAHGWQTAIIGKEGPARIQDPTATPDQTLILDDATGGARGLGLPGWFEAGRKSAGLAALPPAATIPAIAQEEWMARAANDVVLPHFKQGGKPFILLFWSRDPDYAQHNAKDRIGSETPGVKNPTSQAGVHNADTVLGALMARLKSLGLNQSTDIFVTADHGFVTTTHKSGARELPNGFLLSDLSEALKLPRPKPGMLGIDADHPEVIVGPNANADLIYLPGPNAKDRAEEITSFLLERDYVSAVFVNDSLGRMRGALLMSMINLIGSARTPQPAIYVTYKSSAGDCRDVLQCTIAISDTPLRTGQGNHGGFSRAETRNFMAAIGPDFKKGFADPAPVSNADIAPTLAHLMGFALPARGKLVGRVAGEALVGGKPVQVEKHRVMSEPDPNSGLRTVLEGQSVGATRYFDAAGIEGRVVGLMGQ